ncbi:MAG TPA: hypothetical protein VIO85_10365 [Candidatus Dormibacteraeota bacterium]
MSSAYGVVGLVLLVVAAMVMVQGAWMAITGRRPTWMKSQYPPIGRERGFGTALIVMGLGAALQAAAFIETFAFSSLRLVGIGLFLLGGVFVIVVFRPRPSE